MKHPRIHNGQFSLDFLQDHELIVDNFAGGGGATAGIEKAFGRHVDIAINHDPEAIALHKANHPYTTHYCESVWDVDPRHVTNGRPVGLAWFSPDCTHFSKAKGGKPKSKAIRGLAWVAIRWAATVRPRIIALENVTEFQTWGPLDESGSPKKEKQGETFQRWKNQLESFGYVIEHRELSACDFGAHTIRKRFFLIARCDGHAIRWPKVTHAAANSNSVLSGLLKPWNQTAECIDWSLPVPSIFTRNKPLVDKTLTRLAKGVFRFVLEEESPFIVPVNNLISKPGTKQQVEEWLERYGPAEKISFISEYYGASTGFKLTDPLRTVTSNSKFALVQVTCVPCDQLSPLKTQRAQERFYGFITKYYGTNIGSSLAEPLHTITSGGRKFGLVVVKEVNHQIVDIGLRMLTQQEQYFAQGFDRDYKINILHNGKTLTKKAQQRMCGNSVSPIMAYHLVRANLQPDGGRFLVA